VLLELNGVEDRCLGAPAPRHGDRFAATGEGASITSSCPIVGVLTLFFIFPGLLEEALLAAQSLFLFTARRVWAVVRLVVAETKAQTWSD
jgi:hypothetical protein